MKYLPDILPKWALVLILITFLLPELLVWGVVDSFEEPIRSYRGDTAHYMTVLNSALIKGGPEGNSFLYEGQDPVSRFFVFESLVGVVGLVVPISASVLAIILQVLVPLLIFYILYSIFIAFGIEEKIASFVSLLHTLVYGVIVYDGYGLAFWFVPFLLLGIWVLIANSVKDFFTPRSGLMVVFSIVLFTLHPAYFAFGGALTSIVWLALIKKYGLRAVFLYALLWLSLTLTLFLLIFADSITGSVVNNDLLTRMALIKTRFPIHPLEMIQMFLVGIALFSYRKFNILAAAFLIGFAALLAPTITGSYLVNDHYVIAKDYLILAVALVLVYSETFKKRVWLGWILLVTTILDIFIVLNYFNFQLGYYGKYVTIHVALLVISLILISPNIHIFLRRVLNSKYLRVSLICVAMLYALVLQYKDYTNARLVRDRNIQEYRPLFEHMRNLPKGVVVADNALSFFIPVFTPQKVYWSSLASSQPAPTLNILTRFEDVHPFFPDDESHQPPGVISYLFGAIDRCREFNRKGVLEKLASFGFEAPLAEICAPLRERQVRYDALKDVLEERYQRTLASREWQPTFRVDYLILTEEDRQVPAWLIEKYFTEIDRVSGAIIYRYNQ
ncbi:MAG: hypothetical protein A2665_01075 [Candidatus Zambryskibacteria bacterium RIFCSPHIGHO2_01_FULL_46_30]|uniref:Uncharacterized protein n=1 Tax=Candidatus Zambryskibacteria bacterium RIFCSPHIGHO2_01_FULL_46_30 TaxID=1802739 RepID=A0A1G2T246_9BACT|nr:MAG: hypothetical protein A2665_01075 [Candidatus Zambryskibacteria bacterium RIFCSPHIGHO2_01_FULL_46_30]OHB06092.1 MAG: hypothetical protein A3B22_02235 [Candidatus Zambryskibacteria bacterium RIFCSPLOWO2_01_FULL_47_33]